MWMLLRGSLYGVLAFALFFIVFFVRRFSISTSKAISVGTLRYLTVENVWMWATLVLLIGAGCACVKWWSQGI